MNMKKMLQAFSISVAIVSVAIVLVPNANAFSLGGIKSALGGGSNESVDFGTTESEVVGLINTSLKNLSQAQEIMAAALGLKEVAAIAEKNANDLSKGEITGKDELADKIKNSKSLTEKIVAKLKQKEELSAEAKKKFTSGLLPYGKGVVSGIAGAKKAADAFQSMSSNPMNLSKFGTLVYVGKEAPGLISMFADATSAIKDFSSQQGIKTDDLKAAEESGL